MTDEISTDERILFFQKKKKGKRAVVPVPKPPLETPVADTHAHLDMLEDAPLALARAAYFGVGFICAMGNPVEKAWVNYQKLDEWDYAASHILSQLNDLAPGALDKTPHVRIAVGCHPHEAKDFDTQAEQSMIDMLKDPRTCAVGEVGLDYHYDYSPRPVQRDVFRRQIELAHESGLPLILHLREAHEEAYGIMDEAGYPEAGVLLHCFNRTSDILQPWLDKGCYVALGGALTFKKNDETRDAVKNIPENRLLTETDAPFMTPEPMRSSTCEPAHTIFVAQKVAEVKDCEPGDARKVLLQQMYDNAHNLLDGPATSWQNG